jgi:hypothetical protein
VLKGALLGLPLTALFAALLLADPNFARAVMRAANESGNAARFVGLSAATALGMAFAYAVARRVRGARDAAPPRAPAWAMIAPYRAREPSLEEDEARGPVVRPLTWAVVLAQLVVVFGLFVAANARTLFVDHTWLMAPGTTTYAKHLHAGFAQLTIAVVLAVITVLVGHRLMADRDGAADSKTAPGGAALAALEATLLALVALALASCWHRLRVYEQMYGYTYERLGVALFDLGVLGLLLATMLKSLARRWRGYGSTVATFATLFVVFVGCFDADAWIAKANVARAAQGRPLDVDYLATLSADAGVVLKDPIVAGDWHARMRLETAWRMRDDEQREGGWRARRGLRERIP